MSKVKRSTWYKWTREEFETGQTIWREVVFVFLLFIYVSSYIFYFNESTIITTEKQKAKQIQKKIYINVEGKPLPIVFDYVLPIRQSSPLFFFLFKLFLQLVLKLHPYLLAPFTINGRKSPRSPYLFSYSFPSFGEEQKSPLFVFKVGIQF